MLLLPQSQKLPAVLMVEHIILIVRLRTLSMIGLLILAIAMQCFRETDSSFDLCAVAGRQGQLDP